ncbi:hypothetical protein ZTR_04965 [Talaromyces verruculosus]|nr:hypothetical protein ZTR_04965 [Talaromyces verruculosus]
MRFGRANVPDREFEAAAHRLLLADHKRSTVIAVRKADLQILVQLFLLRRAEDRLWRAGLSKKDEKPRTGDIMFSCLISDPDEVSRASELASAFLAYQFSSSDDYVTWEQFEAWCSECPSFIFFFFQLWATIFVLPIVPQAPRAEDKSALLVSTTNILPFLNVAYILGGKRQYFVGDRIHQSESQFQLDLQASTLVADLATTPELSVEELHKTITTLAWFHVIVIQGEDLNVMGKSSSRLIVGFTSPPETEMWRGGRRLQYVWRASVVQLEPDLVVADSGGMSASVVSEALELRSHGGQGKTDATSLKVGLARKIVHVKGLGTGIVENAKNKNAMRSSEATSTLEMRLTDLKCYRMPGRSGRVTTSEGVTRRVPHGDEEQLD